MTSLSTVVGTSVTDIIVSPGFCSECLVKPGEKTPLSFKIIWKGEKIMTLMLFWDLAVVDAAMWLMMIFWCAGLTKWGAASAHEVQVFLSFCLSVLNLLFYGGDILCAKPEAASLGSLFKETLPLRALFSLVDPLVS